MVDTGNTEANASEAAEGAGRAEDTGPPMVVAVFVNPDVLVNHHKPLGDAINGNQAILARAGETGSVAICSRKSALTRHLLLGPMQVASMEYNHKDWQSATQGFQHLPDLVLQRHPKMMVVISEEGRLLLNVLRTLLGNNRVTDDMVRRYADFVKEALTGDIYIVDPEAFATGTDAMDGFERIHSLDQSRTE